jgi:hypothetical protein
VPGLITESLRSVTGKHLVLTQYSAANYRKFNKKYALERMSWSMIQ